MTKNLIKFSLIAFSISIISACSKTESGSPMGETAYRGDSADGGNSGGQNQPGVITAGEWNDLYNWDFWQNLLKSQEYEGMPSYWSFFHNHRISVKVETGGNAPVIDATVDLKRARQTLFTARTDNQGQAELWVGLWQKSNEVDYSTLSLDINQGAKIVQTVKPYTEGANVVTLPTASLPNKVDICFVVDATGSMGDELEYLKTELVDVLSRVEQANPNSSIATSSVFYRDEGDAYVTKTSPFTSNYSTTINFIKKQSADGGGDFPEAVHTALEKSISDLQWSSSARARLLFLLLDAPPHYKPSVINSLQQQIQKASEKGIKIIPITASGIDKNTEFLMRFFAMTTNGTYVFITNHSGVGDDHLEASVGEYQVEFLNDLMVRLINKNVE